MNRLLVSWVALVALTLQGQSVSLAAQEKYPKKFDREQAEARWKLATVEDSQAANRVLLLAKHKDFGALERLSRIGKTSNERLFASYLLYRLNPKRYRTTFVQAFPIRYSDVDDFLECASSLPYLPSRETNVVVRPGVKWAISFDEIEAGMFELVKAGEPDAVLRFFCLEGRGDGAVGEGLGSDFMELYVEHPDLVIQFWSVFQHGVGYLQNIDMWYSQEVKESTRARYCKLLKAYDPRLATILKEIDSPPN